MNRSPWLILLIILASCSDNSKFRIEGIVDRANKKMIYLDEQGVETILPIDSARIKKSGEFIFKGKCEYPKFYNLRLQDNKILPMLISPGEKVYLKTSLESFGSNYSLEGSVGSMQIKMLNDRLAETKRKLDSIRIVYSTPPITKEKQELFNAAIDSIVENQRRFTLEFVLGHLNSMASIYAVYQKFDDKTFILYKNRDIQILKITGAALDTTYPKSPHVRALVSNAASLVDQIYSSGLRNLMQYANAEFPEIALPDPYGDTIRLSSLKGKVVLLSFWASWNNSSMDFNTSLLELYRQYKSRGFEIFQVSLDNNKDEWVQAIKYEELPWINVSDLSYPKSVIAGNYNVQSLPANYLLNRSGVIVGKNLSVSELNSRVPELIANN